MFAKTNKPDMAARLCADLIQRATDPRRGINTMTAIQHFAGVIVEMSFVFGKADQAMETLLVRLSAMLECKPSEEVILHGTLPPAHVMDLETERGRAVARTFFDEWLDCQFEFAELFLTIIHNMFIQWEEHGYHRSESLRLLAECSQRCMAYEIAAQELCDIVIENKVAREGWSLAQCIASLSAVAGRKLALSLSNDIFYYFDNHYMPENLDRVVYVMTQEAIRLGVPAGSDWRLGLAANDTPVNAPTDLIASIEPYCHSFFATMGLFDRYEQAVCCAKAAGRMIAVASGGEEPEMEPAIAKPLAMAAITETYKFMCMDYAQASL